MDNLKIAIVGADGTSLLAATAFGNVYPVIVFDPDGSKKEPFEKQGIPFTDRPEALSEAGILLLTGSKRPAYTLDALSDLCRIAGTHMKKGTVLIFEAPVYPGTTEETCIPILEQHSGLKADKEFFIGFAPARWNNNSELRANIPKMRKVISGQSRQVTDYLADLFAPIHDGGIYKAKSIRVAEAAQLLEIAQTQVNIALMNEVALTLNQQGIDTHDVLETANTKRGFIKFEPDLLGDNHVFWQGANPSWCKGGVKGRQMAQRIIKKLIQNEVIIHEARITILGITKMDSESEVTEVGVIGLVSELQEYGIDVQVSDAKLDLAKAECAGGVLLTRQKELLPAVAVVLAVPHEPYRQLGWKLFERLLEGEEGYVFDVKSVLERNEKPEKVTLWRM
ncbi:nucleotide sugar dehydrogenase [Planococcus sp. ISL-109]|uniref:nucleotide sugar dehydrogenase n=1 Tax=Planococcus sp. ISL-109 TaxID=2819166 RepID=UPI001BE65DB7|nr:nucleotide sugar dehydrogenase [Planococcus sp. ISL-109]MBT2581539.1 nucleotide sugar dehydrogenase [Planococcus sp. ISL-109]